MTHRDVEMIKAMAFIKEYCNDIDTIDGCINCPMYDNCNRTEDNNMFPYYWYIPDIECEKTQGNWIMNKTSSRGRNYTCTNCKKISRNKFHFCPNCGAEMRGDNNE